MGILLNNQQPYSLGALTLPFLVALPNASPGWKLWIDNESSYAFTFKMDNGNPMLCPSNYSLTIHVDSAAPIFTFISIFGSGSAQGTSNVFLFLIAPNEPDIENAAKYPISRYPASPNYGFAPRIPNGGIYGSSQKNVPNGVPTIPTSKATQLDMLDFPNVIFYEDWEGYNVATGSTYNLTSISGAVSACGVPWGYGQPGAAMGYYNQPSMHYAGVPRTPVCIPQPAVNTTVVTPPLFPQFTFPLAATGIEMVMYGTMQITTTVGTLVSTFAYFLLQPCIQVGIQLSGSGYTTSTLTATAYQTYNNLNQAATFNSGSSGQGTTAINFRVAIKAILNSGGTYDIYCAYSNTTTLTALPAKVGYSFVMSLSSATFLSSMTNNLAPGFALQTVVGAGTTTTPTSVDMGIYSNSAVRANGVYAPCLQINVP